MLDRRLEAPFRAREGPVDQREPVRILRAYYYCGGRYYDRVYVVVDPPLGAEVPTLPEEAREMKVDGQTYWQFDRIFYKPLGDVFVVVSPPAPKAEPGA